jgi:hypothetical protein
MSGHAPGRHQCAGLHAAPCLWHDEIERMHVRQKCTPAEHHSYLLPVASRTSPGSCTQGGGRSASRLLCGELRRSEPAIVGKPNNLGLLVGFACLLHALLPLVALGAPLLCRLRELSLGLRRLGGQFLRRLILKCAREGQSTQRERRQTVLSCRCSGWERRRRRVAAACAYLLPVLVHGLEAVLLGAAHLAVRMEVTCAPRLH